MRGKKGVLEGKETSIAETLLNFGEGSLAGEKKKEAGKSRLFSGGRQLP